MIPLETKESGDKLLHHSDLRGDGGFLGETLCSIQRGMKIGTWNVRSLYSAGFLKAAARELARYVLFNQYCAGDKIENEMGWACGVYG